MANNLKAYTNYTSGVDITVGLNGRDLGPGGRDVFSGLNLATAITSSPPAPWNGLTFYWDTSNLASQKLYVKGTPTSPTASAGNWRELEIATAGGDTAIFRYRLRVSRDPGDGDAIEVVHGWDEFNHVSVRTKGDTARVDAALSMVGVKAAMSMNGVNGSANINGLNLGLNITGSNFAVSSTGTNFAVSYTALSDVRFNYGPLLEVTSTHYPSSVLPQIQSGSNPAPGQSVYKAPSVRVGRRIAKTKFPPIQLTFSQAHNYQDTGGSDSLNAGLYLPSQKDFESVLGLGVGPLVDATPLIGMRSTDAAYGAPPHILLDLKTVWDSMLGSEVSFPTGGNTGVGKQADFIKPIAPPVELDTFAKSGATCSFIFSAGASQTFQFRSAAMRTFTFGGGTSHHFSPIREMFHHQRSVMAEKDLLLVKSHATYHYECLKPLKGDLIDSKAKKFAVERDGDKGMVNYRYEGRMRMSRVKVDGAGEEKTVKDISSIQMGTKTGVRIIAKKLSFFYHKEAMEPGEVDPADRKKGGLRIDETGVAMQGTKIKLMDEKESAEIEINGGRVQIKGKALSFNGQAIRVE